MFQCENDGDLAQYFYTEDNTCHEHFTRGPCEGNGNLFLPDGSCGCNVKLPHYHDDTDQCYEIGKQTLLKIFFQEKINNF